MFGFLKKIFGSEQQKQSTTFNSENYIRKDDVEKIVQKRIDEYLSNQGLQQDNTLQNPVPQNIKTGQQQPNFQYTQNYQQPQNFQFNQYFQQAQPPQYYQHPQTVQGQPVQGFPGYPPPMPNQNFPGAAADTTSQMQPGNPVQPPVVPMQGYSAFQNPQMYQFPGYAMYSSAFPAYYYPSYVMPPLPFISPFLLGWNINQQNSDNKQQQMANTAIPNNNMHEISQEVHTSSAESANGVQKSTTSFESNKNELVSASNIEDDDDLSQVDFTIGEDFFKRHRVSSNTETLEEQRLQDNFDNAKSPHSSDNLAGS